MDAWGGKLLSAMDAVAQAAALGLGLPRGAFADALRGTFCQLPSPPLSRFWPRGVRRRAGRSVLPLAACCALPL